MADTNLHIAGAPAKPALYDDLRRLVREASMMEDAIRGAAGALHAICHGGMLDSLPKDEADHASHEAATGMLRMIENHLRNIIDAERDWDLSCELTFLADKAKAGKIIRYGALVPEGN